MFFFFVESGDVSAAIAECVQDSCNNWKIQNLYKLCIIIFIYNVYMHMYTYNYMCKCVYALSLTNTLCSFQ